MADSGSSSSRKSPTTRAGKSLEKRRAQNMSTPQSLLTSQPQTAITAINVQGTDQSVVLFGVNGPRITLELGQIDTIKYGRDDQFFWNFKQQYEQHRGFLRYWFSVWRLSHCDFVKVISNTMLDASNRLQVSVREDLGCRNRMSRQRSTYRYNIRLRSKTTTRREPIHLPHEFEAAFALCGDHGMLAPFHGCSRVTERHYALRRIPKRKLELKLKTDEREHVLGLQAQHVMTSLYVLFYHCLILGGPIGFWAWWLFKPNDLQSAAIPVTSSLALLSLFRSFAGVLKNPRGATCVVLRIGSFSWPIVSNFGYSHISSLDSLTVVFIK